MASHETLVGADWRSCRCGRTGGGSQAYERGLCYETIGCVQDRLIDQSDAEKLGCDQLWTVRNGIYAVRGYCFKTERGKAELQQRRLQLR